MGLDWNPGNRPIPGCEEEHDIIVSKLAKNWCWRRKGLIKRFQEISIPAFETLKAPQVGFDERATQWARERYREHNGEIKGTEKEYLETMRGYYVVDLVPPCDGLPKYSNSFAGYVEPFSFRAELLKDCEEIIGKEMLKGAFKIKTSREMMAYGKRLKDMAQRYALENKIDLSELNTEDTEGMGSKLDVVMAAAKWCIFWGGKGHILEPFF
ncbi:MAG: hypothetical protein HQL30_02540 [Candidatus Omnitrophica bacterium]|nr:hypothetical protein [Candidatus Omnitrophota bacterium]